MSSLRDFHFARCRKLLSGVSFGIKDQSDEAVLANARFLFLNSAAVLNCAGSLNGTVCTGEVNDRASAACIFASHLSQGAGATGVFGAERKCPKLDAGTFQPFER